MNISPVVNAVKGFAASEGGKAVATAAKKIGSKALKGFTCGASAGMLVVGTRFGYKAATKGLPTVLKPVEEILAQMTAGAPDFTVTFHRVEAPKTEEQKNDSEQKPEEKK